MISRVNGSIETFLLDLNRIQSRQETAQRQLGSGLRVEKASDDPAAIPGILDILSRMATVKQSQTNLQQLSTELETGDAALQDALKAIESAITLGTKAGGDLSETERPALIQEVIGIQQQLVTLSRTSVAGRYIFSGDCDQQPLYALDDSSSGTVTALATPTATTVVTDAEGNTIWSGRTAQQIFDARTSAGEPDTGNVFAAVSELLNALRSGDATAAVAAVGSLTKASEHLDIELSFYGAAETRTKAATDSASESMLRLQTNLGDLRDADAAGAAIELTQAATQQQAALSAGAKISKLSLFDYIA
jgi:flagellar hook-associated protein 3 FlgL